jgi:hypothetical protein
MSRKGEVSGGEHDWIIMRMRGLVKSDHTVHNKYLGFLIN